MFEGVTLPCIRPRSTLASRKDKLYTGIITSFVRICTTIHYFVRSHVSSDADFKRPPLLAGGCSAGQVLVGSSVEGHLSEYATVVSTAACGVRSTPEDGCV